jgi:F-type H+-transporting ATPase subunit a
MEHELWFTALLNKFLAGVVAVLLTKLGLPPADPAHPIPNYIAMEILVIVLMIGCALWLRRRLSVENPGKFQQAMEVLVEFTQNLTDETIGEGGRRYVAMIGTLGLFVVLCNLWGLVPTFETPTAEKSVPAGCAVAAFCYYNWHGIRELGLLGYLRHLCGPIWYVGIIMFPIEVFSNLFRMVSLTARLWANMLAGDLLEQVFSGLIPIAVPVIFAALHILVSVLQAYVFMLLPAIYISMAVSEEH